jgi:aspartate oxidase
MKEYMIAPIIIVILLILMMFFYYKWDSSVKTHNNYIQSINNEKIKADINKPVDEVTKRELELYPKINSNITQINKDVKTLNELIKRLEKTQPTREQSNEKFKNESLTEISNFFTVNNYPNTIISK